MFPGSRSRFAQRSDCFAPSRVSAASFRCNVARRCAFEVRSQLLSDQTMCLCCVGFRPISGRNLVEEGDSRSLRSASLKGNILRRDFC